MEYFEADSNGVYKYNDAEILVTASEDEHGRQAFMLVFRHRGQSEGEFRCVTRNRLVYDLREYWESRSRDFPRRGFMRAFLRDAAEMLANTKFAEPDDVRLTIGATLIQFMAEQQLVQQELQSYYRIARCTFQLTQSVGTDKSDDVYFVFSAWFNLLMGKELQEQYVADPESPDGKQPVNPEEKARGTWRQIDDKHVGNNRKIDLIERLTTWFLRRYAIRDANQLIDAQHALESKPSQIAKKILDFAANKWLWLALVILSFISSSFNLNSLSYIFFSLLFTAIVFFALFTGGRFIWYQDVWWFRKMLPRLLGGIVVGYVPLLMAGEMWEFCMNVTWIRFLSITLVALPACWIYLYVEVSNTIRDRKESWNRATTIWGIGCIQSLIVGLTFCDLFGPALIKKVAFKDEAIDFTQQFFFSHLPKEINPPVAWGFLDGLFGWLGWGNLVHSVYPPVVLLYFPLALFIGVFVQIFWEDKPITEPL